MNEEKEDPILAAPGLGKEEPTASISTMDTHNGDLISKNGDSTNDEKGKSGLTNDQRRLSLLNDPNYGVILGFLAKFRTHVDNQEYPLHLLEENLLSDEENTSRRLIDFHITLLKRISLGKGAKRDKFVSIITKFAYRFDYDDGEYLQTNGYSQAQIDIKLRVLKNLLETQFDHNQAFKTALLEKQSFEVRSQPFGRDRSGAYYWLFLDSECFIRLFRENIDDDRAWANIAKDKDELEKLIQLLITDHVVRRKFPEWKFAHEPFNALTTSKEFDERYSPTPIHIKKENEQMKPSTSPLPLSDPIKMKSNALTCPNKPFSLSIVKSELPSDHESSTSADKNGQRSRMASSNDTNLVGSSQEEKQEINNNQENQQTKKARSRRKSSKRTKKKRRTLSNTSKKETQEQKSPVKGRKRKQMADHEEKEKNDEATSQEIHPIPMDEGSLYNDDLPIALRRSRRTRKAPISEPPSVTTSPTKSVSQTPTKKKLTNGKCKTSSQTSVKVSSQSSKTKTARKRSRRRGAGKASMNGASPSSSDEHQPSEEEEDDYNSDDYLPDKKQLDVLDGDGLLEEEEDEYVPRRSAKTVAKRHGQLNNDNAQELVTTPSSACCVCAKTDRPESLLLCDDCDDAYHLECLKPAFLAVPDGDWYCPLCEHKRLSDNLIAKFIQLIKEYEELEIKRNQCMSKRTNRLANVMLNLDRMVKRSSKKRRPNGIVCSGDENADEEEEAEEEDEENNKSEDEEEEEDDDDDSVYGFKDDGSVENGGKTKRSSTSSKRLGRTDKHKSGEPEKLGVRSCRRKPQNYRFDDYDKKMKEAMIQVGGNEVEIDKDSDESEDEGKKKSPKDGADYEKDQDFDACGSKHDAEFAPDPDRSGDSQSEEAEEDDYDDDESSDDGWKRKRRSSAKKKPPSKSNRRKSKNKSDDDDDDESLSDTELNSFQTLDTTKSDIANDVDMTDDGNEDRRRSTRTTTSRNYAKQEEGDTEDDDDEGDHTKLGGRPPPRRMQYKKRRGSDDSFIEDDDYEKVARKREIVKYGKAVSRSSITDHLKKLVENDDQPPENKDSASPSQVTTENEEKIDSVKHKQSPANNDEPQPSDDDDFPDEQEIFKANGLLNLKKNLSGPQATSFRPAFVAPTHLYQHAIVDPTARFAMIRPPVRPAVDNGYPSNGHSPPEEKIPTA